MAPLCPACLGARHDVPHIDEDGSISAEEVCPECLGLGEDLSYWRLLVEQAYREPLRKREAREVERQRQLLLDPETVWFTHADLLRVRAELGAKGEDYRRDVAHSSLNGCCGSLDCLDAQQRESVEAECAILEAWSGRQVSAVIAHSMDSLFQFDRRRNRSGKLRRIVANHFEKRCSCGADIVMARDENGKWQPLDSEIPDGAKVYFALDVSDSEALAHRLLPEDVRDALTLGELFCSHFETCPNADKFSQNSKVK